MSRERDWYAALNEDNYTNPPEPAEWLDVAAGMWRDSSGKFTRAATVGEMPHTTTKG